MSLLRPKFDPATPKKALRPFTFNGVAYKKDDLFNPLETKATLRQMRSLYNNRRLTDVATVAQVKKAKKTKLSEAAVFAAAKASLAAEQIGVMPSYYQPIVDLVAIADNEAALLVAQKKAKDSAKRKAYRAKVKAAKQPTRGRPTTNRREPNEIDLSKKPWEA